MPAEAHGDEHDVCVIFLVPFGSSKRWEEHKPDLVGYTEKPALAGPEKQARLPPTATPVVGSSPLPQLSHTSGSIERPFCAGELL